MRRVRGGLALLALLVLVAGLPAALAATVGNPLGGWPVLAGGDVSDVVVIDVLATVAYLAWAQFVVAVLVEAVAVLGGRGVPRRIPGVFAGQQHLARTLITATLLLGPGALTAVVVPTVTTLGHPPPAAAAVATSPVAPGASADTTGGRPPGPVPAAAARPVTAPPRSVYVVPAGGGPCTYWDLAATHLGSGDRWQEIWDLNRGRTQADGAAMTSPALLRPGWTVLMPADAVRPEAVADTAGSTPVTVHPADTLSGISAREGVPDWTVTWEVNAGRSEPGGERFTDPDLIKPGWTVDVPRPVAATPPGEETVAPQPPPRRPGPGDGAGAAQGSAAPSPGGAGGAVRVDAAEQSAASLWGVFAGGGTLLAAGILGAVSVNRRRQFRYRRPGRTIASTPPEVAPVEKAVVARGSAGAPDVAFLDHALRSLTAALGEDPGVGLPDVVAVRMTGDQLDLRLEAPHPGAVPAPWRVDESGCWWTVRRDEALPVGADNADRYLAPYPALVGVGHDGAGEHWLLDLERAGSVSLTGDEQGCLDLGRFIAAELAVNGWSDHLSVTLVGFGAELVALNPERLTYTEDLAGAVAVLRGDHDRAAAAGRDSGGGVLGSRLPRATGEAWMPHVLVIGPQEATGSEEVAALLAVVRSSHPGRSAVAVLLVGDRQPAAGAGGRLEVSGDGRLVIPALGADLIAQRLPGRHVPGLVALVAQSRNTMDEPVPASAGSRAWEEFADAAGALLPAVTQPRSGPDGGDVPPGVGGSGGTSPGATSVLPRPAATYLEGTATTAEDLEVLAPRVPVEVRGRVEDADARLDEDLAAWRDPGCPLPRLTLLGPVRLSARGTPPERRLPFYTEVVAYLATRDGGVTVAQFAEALWPGESQEKRATARRAVYPARKWLGVNPRTGRPHLPEATESQRPGGEAAYLVEDVLTDADLFRRLRLRGEARGQDGIEDLTAALELVTGAPFDSRRPGGYAWLVDTPLEHIYTGAIVDVAHVVATHALAEGMPARARAAAEMALRAGARDDQALLDLVAVCDREGKQGEAADYVRRIMANHDAEVEEDLPPRTFGILRRRRWLPEAS